MVACTLSPECLAEELVADERCPTAKEAPAIKTSGIRGTPQAGGIKNATLRYELPPPAVAVRNLVRQRVVGGTQTAYVCLRSPNDMIAPTCIVLVKTHAEIVAVTRFWIDAEVGCSFRQRTRGVHRS